jgi:tetratricopeptide (TPR) repeat protein
MTTTWWKHLVLPFCLFAALTVPLEESLGAAEASPALFQRAEESREAKKFSDALALYETLLSHDPGFVPAYRGLVSCYQALGNGQGAVIYGESLLLEHPKSAEASYGLGYALYSVKKYQEANSYFEKAISLNPALAEAWNNSAAIYHFILHDYEKARVYYEKAIAASKATNNVRVREIAEENLAHLPQPEEKLTPVTEHLTLEAFVNRFTTAVDTQDERSGKELVLGQRENSAEAVEWFLRKAVGLSLQSGRDDEKVMVLLATRLESVYSRSFGDSSINKKIAFYKALSYEQKAGIAQAQKLLEEGLRKEQEGLLNDAESRYEEARRTYDSEGDTGSAGLALLYQGDVRRKMKRYHQAQEAYKNALNIFSATGDEKRQALVLSSLGITCYFLGENEQALKSLNRSLEIYRSRKDEEAEKKVRTNIELIESKIRR